VSTLEWRAAVFDRLPESLRLDLVGTAPFPRGIVVQVYQPQRG
jgi:hypothetical protein